MKNLFLKIHKGVLGFEKSLLIILNTILPIMIFISAVMRYVLYKNFTGLTELVVLLVSWLYFTGNAFCTYNNCHINASIADMFVRKKRTMAIIEAIRQVVSLVMYTIVFFLAMEAVTRMAETHPRTAMLRLPQILDYIPIAICFALSIVYTIMHIVRYVKEIKTVGDSLIEDDMEVIEED